jgi:hypothetical protein
VLWMFQFRGKLRQYSILPGSTPLSPQKAQIILDEAYVLGGMCGDVSLSTKPCYPFCKDENLGPSSRVIEHK